MITGPCGCIIIPPDGAIGIGIPVGAIGMGIGIPVDAIGIGIGPIPICTPEPLELLLDGCLIGAVGCIIIPPVGAIGIPVGTIPIPEGAIPTGTSEPLELLLLEGCMITWGAVGYITDGIVPPVGAIGIPEGAIPIDAPEGTIGMGVIGI
jgi:hypothetical protein